jgi:hypothetical protein
MAGLPPPQPSHPVAQPILCDFFSEHQLAAELKTSLRSLRRWQELRTGPLATHIGRRTFYPRENVKAWLEQQTRKPLRRGGRTA